jgi:hypothetical protein
MHRHLVFLPVMPHAMPHAECRVPVPVEYVRVCQMNVSNVTDERCVECVECGVWSVEWSHESQGGGEDEIGGSASASARDTIRYDTIRYDGWELGVAEARHMGWWSVVGMKCGGAKCGGGGGRNDDSGGYGGENRMELETKTTPRIHESTTDPKRPDLSHLFPRLFETAVAFPRDPTQLSPSSFQIAVPFLRSITRRSSSWTSDFLLNVEVRFLVHATPRHAAFPFPSSSPRHLRRDPPAG